VTTLERRIVTARHWYEKTLAKKGAKMAERYRLKLTTLLLKRAEADGRESVSELELLECMAGAEFPHNTEGE
jgi:hypothetical protein